MPESREPEQILLTPRKVASRLGVSVRTLWRMEDQDGFPPPIRFNRKTVRWKESDVQRYIDSLSP
jgi:predicted DNA-binding transcriptional regulator AlpA